MGTPRPLGKLRPALLADLCAQHVTPDPRLSSGRVDEDAAVFDMGDRYLVATTDPITPLPRFDQDEITRLLA